MVPEPPDLPRFEHAEQLGLQLERELADLVEEHRPAAGLLEHADPPRHGAGEGALLVAEQLGLEQVGRQRAAVHDQEAVVSPARLAWMDSAAWLLPVPVSPSRSTVTSEAAARSIRAKLVRGATELPTSEPKLGAPRAGAGLLTRQLEAEPARPSPRRLPLRSAASFTSTPSRRVPFRLPRSFTQMRMSGATKTSQ